MTPHDTVDGEMFRYEYAFFSHNSHKERSDLHLWVNLLNYNTAPSTHVFFPYPMPSNSIRSLILLSITKHRELKVICICTCEPILNDSGANLWKSPLKSTGFKNTVIIWQFCLQYRTHIMTYLSSHLLWVAGRFSNFHTSSVWNIKSTMA